MLYPSGLIMGKAVYDDRSKITLAYTKHYYIGSERISAKTGTLNNFGAYPQSLLTSTISSLSTVSETHLRVPSQNSVTDALTNVGEIHQDFSITLPESTIPQPREGIIYYGSHAAALLNIYYFHPDHLGSSCYMTNRSGVVCQHMEYLPFGETLVDEHLNSNNSPFKYNGKEFDEETGNYYYGARYYDPKLSIFISVDPLAEKHPNISSYAYCFSNPINYIDPDGRDGVVSGSGTAVDPFVVSANYYYYGLNETQASGLQEAISAYNNNGEARSFKDNNGNRIFVVMNLTATVAENEQSASNMAFADQIDTGDQLMRFGNVVTVGGTSTDDHFGKATALTITLNQGKITSTLGSNPGGNENILIKGTFIHEIGHNLGASHGDPGNIMSNISTNEQKNANQVVGGGKGTYNYKYPSINNSGVRAFMGRVDSPGAVDSFYLTQKENRNVQEHPTNGAPGVLRTRN